MSKEVVTKTHISEKENTIATAAQLKTKLPAFRWFTM